MREIFVHSDLVLSLKYVSEVKRESKIANDKMALSWKNEKCGRQRGKKLMTMKCDSTVETPWLYSIKQIDE